MLVTEVQSVTGCLNGLCAFLNYKSAPSSFIARFKDSNMSEVRIGERDAVICSRT
jgi:hypothetical protein